MLILIQEIRRSLKIRIITVSLLFLAFWYPCFGAYRCSAAEDLYETRLDKGLFNTEPYSYLLIQKAHEEKGRAREYLLAARKYSPDLPAVYFELAGGGAFSFNGIFESIDYFRQGLKAYERNFWWLFSLAGLFSLSLMVSYVLSLCMIIAIRFPVEYRLLSHDIGEDRRKVFFLAFLIPLSLFGFLAFVAGALFVFGLYFRPREKALVYVALLSLLLSPAMTKFANKFLSPSSPELRAVVAVNEGRDNSYALMTLRQTKDFVSAFSYALALKREGRYEEAIGIYKSLIGQKRDALVFTNLGNAYYAANDLEAAKEAYMNAIEIMPLPAAHYNLSQIHREMLDFVKGDEHFFDAAKLDHEAVSRFSSISGSNPNRFVMDEPLPMSTLWEYVKEKNGGSGLTSVMVFGSALIMIPAFYFLNKGIKGRAYRCARCGGIFCGNCSRGRMWGGLCPQCYKFFIRVEELDSRERIARLSALYQSKMRRRRIMRLMSGIIPGTGQIYAGRLTAGMLFLWSFLFSVSLLLMNHFPFPGLSPFRQGWITLVAVIPAAFAYMFSIFHMRRGIQKGWL